MNRNKRQELSCECCGKSRMLSPSEADQDGWIFSTEYGGLICNQCAPKYGIPTTFLDAPVRLMCTESRGFRAEYERGVVREVRQKF